MHPVVGAGVYGADEGGRERPVRIAAHRIAGTHQGHGRAARRACPAPASAPVSSTGRPSSACSGRTWTSSASARRPSSAAAGAGARGAARPGPYRVLGDQPRGTGRPDRLRHRPAVGHLHQRHHGARVRRAVPVLIAASGRWSLAAGAPDHQRESDGASQSGHLRGSARDGTVVDLGIGSGRFQVIGEPRSLSGSSDIDRRGRALVTESFVNAHLHLDKVYTLGRAGEDALAAYTRGSMGGAMTGIELARAVKNGYDSSWILPNVRRALPRVACASEPCTSRRSADVDTTGRLEGCASARPAGPRGVQGRPRRSGRRVSAGGCAARSWRRRAVRAGDGRGRRRGRRHPVDRVSPTPMPRPTSTGPARLPRAWVVAWRCSSTTPATRR